MIKFKDRFDAGRQLAAALQGFAGKPNTMIIAIPRGGLQIGSVLSQELQLPLDVIFTKKIGYPGNPEYAIGAVSATHVLLQEEFAHDVALKEYIAHEISSIRSLLADREHRYRGNKPPLDLKNKTVIVTDDGVATGSTLIATLNLIKQDKPAAIIVALPVCPLTAFDLIKKYADEVVCLQLPKVFYGVGQFYEKFDQVDDQEAVALLHKAYQ